MILAAGRGERMRPLTDHTPKALLKIKGKYLIINVIEALVRAGVVSLVINHAHLGKQIERAVGDGRTWGVSIRYSPETTALETAGGIVQALPLLGDAPFIAVNADVYSDFQMRRLMVAAQLLHPPHALAELVLVPNPAHHPMGDFGLMGSQVLVTSATRYTFSGMGAYHPRLFTGLQLGVPTRLADVLRAHMPAGQIRGQLHRGTWEDVGTPERLAALNPVAAS